MLKTFRTPGPSAPQRPAQSATKPETTSAAPQHEKDVMKNGRDGGANTARASAEEIAGKRQDRFGEGKRRAFKALICCNV